MRREEFISELRSRLERLPGEELEAALDYYNEIFLDAGEDKEEETAESLGSIDEIARNIYVENGIDPDGRPTFILDERRGESRQEDIPQQRAYAPAQTGAAPQQSFKASNFLLLLCLFPLWFPLLIVGFVFTFVFFILGFVLEIVFVGAGTAMVIGGIISLFTVPPAGLMSLGAGLILVALFILTFKGVFKGTISFFVSAINKIVKTAHNILFGGAAANG
ncbi:MAG: hypothetical protein IKO27_00900 [Ruminococcus sp.]|nr:hypothetical protein [Ruminococcus sp.]